MGHLLIGNAHLGQLFADALDGLVLKVGQLGMLMEVAAHLHHIGLDGLCQFIDFHALHSSCMDIGKKSSEAVPRKAVFSP